jgi:hypothetical protein
VTTGSRRGKTGVRRGATAATVRRIARALPGTAEGPSYGTPGYRVEGRLFARLKEDGETLVLGVDRDLREGLLAANPKAFFLTDHYRAYDWVLVRLKAVTPAELVGLLREAWQRRAPRRDAGSRAPK